MADFTVTCLEENEDGSANIEVEFTQDSKELLLKEGIMFLLIKGTFDLTTEQLVQKLSR